MSPVKIVILLSLLSYQISCETVEDAASYTRWILSHETSAAVATFENSSQTLYPFVTVEDYCEHWSLPGYPFFLLANISTTAKNLDQDTRCSLSITIKNCTQRNYENMPYDKLACYRVSFQGELLQFSFDKEKDLQKFLQCHPAAKYWFSAHDFNFWVFHIDTIRYIGGYGNLHYIGDIPLQTYLQASPIVPP